MGRQFGSDDSSDNNVKKTSSVPVIVIVACVVAVIFGVVGYFTGYNNRTSASDSDSANKTVDKTVAENVTSTASDVPTTAASEQANTQVVTNDKNETFAATDAPIENIVDEDIEYPFGIGDDAEVFTVLNEMYSLQKDVVELRSDVVSKQFDVLSLGPIDTDSFQVNSNGDVVNYISSNSFCFPMYMADESSNEQRVISISMLESECYYDLAESEADVLKRLFDYDEASDELKEKVPEDSFLYAISSVNGDDSLSCIASFRDIHEKQNFTRKDGEDNKISYEFTLTPYMDLYGAKVAPESFSKMCSVVDEYNVLRLKYLSMLEDHLREYIKAHK